jgi:hypothetical protein
MLIAVGVTAFAAAVPPIYKPIVRAELSVLTAFTRDTIHVFPPPTVANVATAFVSWP